MATLLNRRLSLPYDTPAVLFGCGASTLNRMLKHTGQLLDQHGTVIEPVASPENLVITSHIVVVSGPIVVYDRARSPIF